MSTIHYTNCPLCKSDAIALHSHVKDHSISGEQFDLWQCKDCQFLFTQDIPAPTEIGAYYKSDAYISHSDSKEGIINKMYHRAREIMLHKKYRLVEGNVLGKQLLDYGAGTGYFLNYMKQKGFQVHGVEIDEEARQFCQEKFNISVQTPEALMADSRSKVWDAITMWHVMEHVFNLHELMQQYQRMLKDDGKLFIAVPNYISADGQKYGEMWAGLDVPRHLWHFEPSTMTRFVEMHGFEVASMHRMPFDPFYNSLLSEKYLDNPMALIKGGLSGLTSTLSSAQDIRKSSSLIYIIKKSNIDA